MKAFARISDKEIRTYAPVVNPDVVVVIDHTLLDAVDVTEGLGEKGILLVNTHLNSDDIKKKTQFNGKCMTVDATRIAIDAVGRNLPNTPMIGALIKATNCISMDDIEESINHKFLKKIGEEKTKATINAVKKAYDEVK